MRKALLVVWWVRVTRAVAPPRTRLCRGNVVVCFGEKKRYRFSREEPQSKKDVEVYDLEYQPALMDGRVLGAGYRKSVDPELWDFGVPARVSATTWLLSGLWYESTGFSTGFRVLAPALVACIISAQIFPALCAWLAPKVAAPSLLIPQLAPLVGLVFSVFTNFTFQAMYEQQEAAMIALFQEVSCAKALVEQIMLVFGGRAGYRDSRCARALGCVRRYCSRDLRRRASRSALQLKLAIQPAGDVSSDEECVVATGCYDIQDPLEELLFLSSVGDPSDHVYATVKELRKLRAQRLGALERKLPPVHFILLYGLAGLLQLGFLLEASASLSRISGLQVETAVFGLNAFLLVACLRILQDIWSPKSGAYNVDAVLVTSVMGLEKQLDDLLGLDDDSSRNYPLLRVVQQQQGGF